MSSMTSSAVSIQTSPQSVPSTPSWFGEVALVARHLTECGLLKTIAERVRFARRRFGQYDVIDFVAVLMGYALSGEATLKAFYERLQPFAIPFMALFGRNLLPHRGTLSRFLAALGPSPVEALRTLFQEDLLSRVLVPQADSPGGLWDRVGTHWLVFDVDGTRAAARQRALPQTKDRPAAHRRLSQVCAPGYLGRKRGEVVRTRTTVLQAHTHQWLGTFSGSGNGDYRGELRRAGQVILNYVSSQKVAPDHTIVRLDGLYGNGGLVAELATLGLAWVMRGRDYDLLDLPEIQARLAQPPDQEITHAESGTCRSLFDCSDVLLTPTGPRSRVVVATHQAVSTPIGVLRDGVVYELFFTALPASAFTASDVVALYLHRGSFETVLSDEDQEQDPDRWCSHSPWGQEFWQVISQWMWNLRLELGHRLHPTAMRTTAFAPPLPNPVPQLPCPPQAEVSYGPPQWAKPAAMGGFPAELFSPQPDGSLRCPAGHPLYAHERRPGRGGSLRVVYAGRVGPCRDCCLREACLGYGAATKKPRRVSALLWPILGPPLPQTTPALHPPASLALLWGDWSRCQTRRAWMKLLRTQTVTITVHPRVPSPALSTSGPLTRPQRAHWRLSWEQRLACNACAPFAPTTDIHLFGIPTAFAASLGLPSRV